MTDTMKITGQIEDKQSKEGNTNGKAWKRFVFKISGKTFSSFDPEMDKFTVGNVVDIEYTSSGGYNNLTSMVLAQQQAVPTPVPASQVPATPQTTAPMKTNSYEQRNKETEASIVAQVIIKELSNLVASGKIEPGAMKSNAPILVDIYKQTKQSLLE